MKIAIIGSRSFNDYSTFDSFIKSKINIKKDDTIVSGGAKGADTLAERFALNNGLEIKVIKPEWNRFGKAAGIIRNSAIVKESDVVFAFWDKISKGTKDTIEKAKKADKKIYVFEFERPKEDRRRKTRYIERDTTQRENVPVVLERWGRDSKKNYTD